MSGYAFAGWALACWWFLAWGRVVLDVRRRRCSLTKNQGVSEERLALLAAINGSLANRLHACGEDRDRLLAEVLALSADNAMLADQLVQVERRLTDLHGLVCGSRA